MNILKDITNFIFIEDEPQKSDIIFIPGGSRCEPSERAAELWHGNYAPLILPSGRYSHITGKFPGIKSKREIYNKEYETEWDFMKDVLVKSGVDDKVILPEKSAGTRGTLDNAVFSKNVTDSFGLTIHKAIICCKSFHARRCLMTYSWIYPQTDFFICPSDVDGLNKNNWYNDPAGTGNVRASKVRAIFQRSRSFIQK